MKRCNKTMMEKKKSNLKDKILVTTIIFLIFAANLIYASIPGQKEKNSNGDLPVYNVFFMKNLFTEVDLNDASTAMSLWVNELLKEINPKFKLKSEFIDNINDIDSSSLKKAAIISLNSIDFLNYKNKLNLDGAFVPIISGSVFDEYIMLTKGNIKKVSELKNAKIGMGLKKNHLISYLWLDVILSKNQLPLADRFFSLIKESEKESRLILSVFFGQLDACVVTQNAYDLMVELNPQIKKSLKIIDKSPGLLTTVTCFSKNFNNIEYRKKVIEGANKLNTYPGGKQILTLMKIEQVTSYKDNYLDNLKKLLKEYNKIILKSKN